MRRPPLVVLAVVATGIGLTGCSSGPQSAGTASSGSGSGAAPVTLTVGTITATGSSAMDNAVAAFEKANPGVKVELVKIPGDQYQQQMRTRVGSGTAPDVFAVFPGNGSAMAMAQLAKGNFLADLSDRPWVSGRVPAIKDASDLDGKTYTTPSWLTLIGGVYNMTAMEQAGAKIPTTYSELLTLCDTAKAKGKHAFALGVAKPWVGQLIPYALSATNVYGKDKDFDATMAAGKATFGDSGWKRSLEQYQEMSKRGCFNDGVLGTDYVTQMGMVAKGETLGAIQVSSADAAAKKVAATVKLQMAAIPATDNAGDTRIPVGPGYGYGLNAKTDKKDAGKKFLDFLASPETSAQLAKENGSLAADASGSDPYNAALVPFVKDGRTATFMDQKWPNPKVQAALQTGVQELLGGTKQPTDVLTAMQTAYAAK